MAWGRKVEYPCRAETIVQMVDHFPFSSLLFSHGLRVEIMSHAPLPPPDPNCVSGRWLNRGFTLPKKRYRNALGKQAGKKSPQGSLIGHRSVNARSTQKDWSLKRKHPINALISREEKKGKLRFAEWQAPAPGKNGSYCVLSRIV